MLQSIINTYNRFHDALIIACSYDTGFDFQHPKYPLIPQVQLSLSAYPTSGNSRDLVVITCKNVIDYRFAKDNRMITEALLQQETDGNYLLEFDPIINGVNKSNELVLERNPESCCFIRCASVEYQIKNTLETN